jgi:UDP-N-acetylmuramate dehydrogenase
VSTVQEHISLLPFNTFGIDASAAHFTTADSIPALRTALQSGIQPVAILGGGSNILLTGDIKGLVIRNALLGKTVRQVSPRRVHVRVAGGENWHEFVLWAVGQGYGGVENLSLIPGTVGASPIQNIGAYGIELKDVFVRLKAMHLQTGKITTFNQQACQFGYRDSIFKRAAKGQYAIVEVTFSLTLPGHHQLNLSYGDITKILDSKGITKPSISDISAAVIQIRSSKLPDPKQIGNCGSFFKNPEVPRTVFEQVLLTHPNAPHYPLADGRVKIPAGWLIEQCGWKGKRVGNTGSYEKQALVLVNHGGATGAEVQRLAQDIIDSVDKKFGVPLEAEVNMW